MEIIRIIILTLILLLPSSSSADTKGWRGIVPLRSTRADVEALLGQGTNQCRCSYYRDDMIIHFVFSSGGCETGGSGDWNIAPDTVIRFTIHPKIKPKLADLKIDLSKFEKREDIGDALIYINDEEGFSMHVQQGSVMSFSYGPAAGDEHLRCPGYDGIRYSSRIPKELRPRFQEMLDRFVHYSFTGQYEKQYEMYLPEFASKMFPVKNSREYAEWVRNTGAMSETWIEFKLQSIGAEENKIYGTVYDVFGYAKTTDGEKIVESPRKTQIVLRKGRLYFIDLFNLIPQ